METILRGEIPDQTPAGFWFHYPSTYSVQEMAEAHLDLYRRTDMDIIRSEEHTSELQSHAY